MAPDYDLSHLESAQVNLWLYLHIDDICAQITGGRAFSRPIPHVPERPPAAAPWFFGIKEC
jgi:hypothetical protein